MRTIWIDADACPVKQEVLAVAGEQGYSVVIVTTRDHHSSKSLPSFAQVREVSPGNDAVDFYLVGQAAAGDIVVTQDYGLASLLLAKQVRVLHHRSFEYTQWNIDQLLMQRYAGAQARKSGKRTKGPKPFTQQDRQKFADFFRQYVQNISEME